MSVAPSLAERIHLQALEAAARYRRAEAEMIEALDRVEGHRVFLAQGYSSLFEYVTSELKLGENVAYTLITVMRKAREVPALGERLRAGAITLTNARRVAAVLTPQNQDEWLRKARELPSRQLEKEIVRVRPQAETPERASYVTPERMRIELGLWERDMLRLRKAQDLVSRAKGRAVSLEETIAVLTEEYVRRHDPVERAKRRKAEKGTQTPAAAQPSGKLKPLVARRAPRIARADSPRRRKPPAAVIHAVNLRDGGRCTEILPNGERCPRTRWIEAHHLIPVREDGPDTPENLVTLCRAHHQRRHGG